MKNTVFLIDSAAYSSELLSYYLEFSNKCKTYRFSNPAEVKNYMKMDPALVIFDQNDTTDIETLINPNISISNNTRFLNVQGNFLEIFSYNTKNKRVSMIESLLVSNMYMSIVDLFNDMNN